MIHVITELSTWFLTQPVRNVLKLFIFCSQQPEEEELDFTQSVSIDGTEYQIGDYVYVTPEEPTRPPHIMSVEKIWQQKDGLKVCDFT